MTPTPRKDRYPKRYPHTHKSTPARSMTVLTPLGRWHAARLKLMAHLGERCQVALLRGDRCYVPGYGDGELWGWDTDYTGVHGASKFVTVRFDDGRVVIVYRADCEAARMTAQP